jgi:hypothetical protein
MQGDGATTMTTMLDEMTTEGSSLRPLTRACRRALAQAVADLEQAEASDNEMHALGCISVVEPVVADVHAVLKGLLALRKLAFEK